MMIIRILRGLTGKRLRWIHVSGTTERFEKITYGNSYSVGANNYCTKKTQSYAGRSRCSLWALPTWHYCVYWLGIKFKRSISVIYEFIPKLCQ